MVGVPLTDGGCSLDKYRYAWYDEVAVCSYPFWFSSMARKFGKDEQTVFFAVKIVVPVVLSLIVAAGIDISSAAHGTKRLSNVVQAAHTSY